MIDMFRKIIYKRKKNNWIYKKKILILHFPLHNLSIGIGDFILLRWILISFYRIIKECDRCHRNQIIPDWFAHMRNWWVAWKCFYNFFLSILFLSFYLMKISEELINETKITDDITLYLKRKVWWKKHKNKWDKWVEFAWCRAPGFWDCYSAHVY